MFGAVTRKKIEKHDPQKVEQELAIVAYDCDFFSFGLRDPFRTLRDIHRLVSSDEAWGPEKARCF